MMAQSSFQTGTFVNTDQTITLQLKEVDDEYHGLLTAFGSNFVLKGTNQGNQLTGVIYATDGPANFTASSQNKSIVVQALGYTETFSLYSTEHSLAEVDLTTYMQGTPTGQSQDFDYSYSQYSRGNASEQKQYYPNQSQQVQSPYPALNDQQLFNLVAGCQLVIYNRTSYLTDNSASSITYVNYCPNGTFVITYDSSFNVEGAYGGNAQGASYGQNSGSWKLVSYQGQPAVFLAFNNGTSNVYPINMQLVRQGRWRNGNTQYAIQRGGAQCR